MNLEINIQSEVNQKEKNKYCVLTHIYETQKDGTDEPVCKAGIEMQTQRTHLWTEQEKERVGRIERVAWKHLHCHMQNMGICCMMQRAQPSAL